MAILIKNTVDAFLNLFSDKNDFINELVLNNCFCYLTGNVLCSKLFNFWYGFQDNLIDRDIYVENIHPNDLLRILIKYGNVYFYGVKNYNFRKNNKNIRLSLVPFGSSVQYEFTFNNDYGATINSMLYKITSLYDIENIDFNKIILENIEMIGEIERRTWTNKNEIKYFKKFENIMRCFNLCTYYGLGLTEKTIINIKNSVNNYIKTLNTYSHEIIFEELVKILNLNDNTEILKIMNDIGCFNLMNMKFKNFEKTVEEMNSIDISENEILRFIKLLDGLDTDNLKRWCIANNVNRAKNITNNIKNYYLLFEYYEEYLKIENKYDMLKFLTKINNKTNLGIEYEYFRERTVYSFNNYITDIKLIDSDTEKFFNLLNECEEYPISLDLIEIDSIVLNKTLDIPFIEFRKTKEKILELIHSDLLKNNEEDIFNYFDKKSK